MRPNRTEEPVHTIPRKTLCRTLGTLAISAAFVCANALPVAAQTPVHWSARAPAGVRHAGATVRVRLTATIDPDWHVYSLTQKPGGPTPLRITVPAGQPFTLGGTVTGPTPHVEFDPNFSMQVEM